MAGTQRSNLFLQFVPFSDFTYQGIQAVQLPEGVTISGPGSVQFVAGMPGVADIRQSNLSTIKRVDFENGVVLSTIPPPVPDGWTRAASNENFAYRAISSNGNTEMRLLDLRTDQEYVVGYGSTVRHNPFKVDVSPDESVMLVAYHESGPIVGNLSWVELHRMQDIIADPANGYRQAEEQMSGNYESHRFEGENITVSTRVYNNSTPDPNDTKVVTVTIPLAQITIPSQAKAVVLNFYGGALPTGATIESWIEKLDSNGQLVGWNVVVRLNNSTSANVVQNQLFRIRNVAGGWAIKRVEDRNFRNVLITHSVFTYNSQGRLTQIDRYNQSGALLSTIKVNRSLGRYEIWAGLTPIATFSLSKPLYLVLKEAAKRGV